MYYRSYAPSYRSTYLYIKRKTEAGVVYKINKIHISHHKYQSSFSNTIKKHSEYFLKKSNIPMCKILIVEITKKLWYPGNSALTYFITKKSLFISISVFFLEESATQESSIFEGLLAPKIKRWYTDYFWKAFQFRSIPLICLSSFWQALCTS